MNRSSIEYQLVFFLLKMYQAAGKTRELLSVRMIKIILVKFVTVVIRPKSEQVPCKGVGFITE